MSRKLMAAALAALFVCSGNLSADSLSGRVLDPLGSSVPNTPVRLFDRNSGELRTTRSSDLGTYAFEGIPAGDYLLEAGAEAAALSASREVTIRGNQTLDVPLSISSTNVEVVVTASSTPLSIQEVAKALDVVDSEQIALRNEVSIAEAVRVVPGIRVQVAEGPGTFTTIQSRGLRNQDTAILVDGMRFRDAASINGDATAMIEDLMVADTDRIEVLRGSGSSLYGSHALGGVVNITSRTGGGRTHGEVRAEGGGLGILRSVVGVGGGLTADRFVYSLNANHINVTKGAREGAPYRNTGTQGSGKYSFMPGLSVTGRVWYGNSYLAANESPTYTPALAANGRGPIYEAIPLPIDQLELYETDQPFSAGNATYIPSQLDRDGRRLGKFLSGNVTLHHAFSSTGSYQVSYQAVDTDRTYLDGPRGPYAFDPFQCCSRDNYAGRIDTVQARVDQRIGDYNLLAFGYEFERDEYLNFSGEEVDATTATELRQRSQAFFAQDQIRLIDGRLQITVAARAQLFELETPSVGGTAGPYQGVSVVEPPNAYTGDGAIAYFFPQTETKLRAHVGNSFRAPSGYERFGGGFGSFYGDPGLRSERAIALDGGIDQWFMNSKLRLSGTMFYTNLQEIIQFGALPATDPFGRTFGGYRNAGGGIARGVEFSGQASPTSTTRLEASYTFTNGEARTPTIPGMDYYEIPGASRHAFSAAVTQWFARRYNVTFDLSAFSGYMVTLFGTDFSSRPFAFDGPVRGDVVFRYDHPFGNDKTLEFYTKVENVFNQRAYEKGFLGPKAWAIAGLRLRY